MPGGGSRLPLGGSDVALRDLSDRACFPRRARHHPAYRGASPFPGDHRPRVFRTGPGLPSGKPVRAARTLFLLLARLAAEAQEGGKIARIGYLGSSPSDPFVEAFRQGLRERGYVEGRNIAIEYRWTEGKFDALPSLAADLVRLKVDVIVAASQGAVAAKQATSTIPIVMPIVTDPVRLGLVESLARPGWNATGFATQNDELPGKWMQLMKETLPKVSRVAVLFQPTYDGGVQFKASETAARSLRVSLQTLTMEGPDDLAPAFA